jgi:hypothetical protein
MSENSRAMAEVSVYNLSSYDLDHLREMKGVVSGNNPLRVHRYAHGFIVSLGMFHSGQGDAEQRLSGLGLRKDAIALMAAAAATGASYLDINADAPGRIAKKSYLDLSTEHLRVRDGDLLQGIGSGKIVGNVPLIVHNHGNGYIIDMRSVRGAEKLAEFGFSSDFVSLIEHARRNEATIIDFDRDAGIEPGFSVFDQVTDEDITPAAADATHFQR